jgi:hypothetical protein
MKVIRIINLLISVVWLRKPFPVAPFLYQNTLLLVYHEDGSSIVPKNVTNDTLGFMAATPAL